MPCATLSNYQNTLMQKSEPRANPTFINCAVMIYEFRAETIETHRSTGSLKIQF